MLGRVLARERFSHDERGMSAPIELLGAHEVEVCAIEWPDGLLVGRLLAASVRVLAIHPNQVKAARDRFRAAAGKDDRFVRSQLQTFWPGAQRIFAEIDSPIALAFLARYPGPEDAHTLTTKLKHDCVPGALGGVGSVVRPTPGKRCLRLDFEVAFASEGCHFDFFVGDAAFEVVFGGNDR